MVIFPQSPRKDAPGPTYTCFPTITLPILVTTDVLCYTNSPLPLFYILYLSPTYSPTRSTLTSTLNKGHRRSPPWPRRGAPAHLDPNSAALTSILCRTSSAASRRRGPSASAHWPVCACRRDGGVPSDPRAHPLRGARLVGARQAAPLPTLTSAQNQTPIAKNKPLLTNLKVDPRRRSCEHSRSLSGGPSWRTIRVQDLPPSEKS